MVRGILREELILRPSKVLSFRNCEIWVEELDAFSDHTETAAERLQRDMRTVRRPSAPSYIAFALYGTRIDGRLAALIAAELSGAGPAVRKVAFVGLKREGKRLLKARIAEGEPTYLYEFFEDFEKGKEWLVPA